MDAVRAEKKGEADMKAKARWLTAGIFAVYIPMYLPWAIRTITATFVGGVLTEYISYRSGRYPFGLFFGDPLSSVSALLAFAALIASLFSMFDKSRRPIVCGILLLASAGLEIAMGCTFGFHCFTILTYFIIAALIGLGIFALFGSRSKG